MLEDRFDAKSGVVFILDIERDYIEKKLPKWKVQGPFWFTDYETFLKVPLGQALTAPIYFRPDGRVEAIKK